MIQRAMTAGLAVAMATSLAAAASAATLSGVSGPVLVDSGKGFVRVSTGGEIAPGSRVLVSKGGGAVLAYADGCQKQLGPNSITTVQGEGACKPDAQVAGQSGTGGGISTGALMGIGAGVAGGALIGYAIGQGNSKETVVPLPISP